MSKEASPVFDQEIKKKGFWNFPSFYDFAIDFLKDKGYFVAEKKYTEKSGDLGKDIEIKWEAIKKVTDYFMYKITVEWRIVGMKDAEITRDGQKEPTNKGDLKIKIKAELIKDYEEKWEDSPFWKFIRSVYDKYVIRTTAEKYEDKFVEECESYIEQLKAFLEL